MTQFSAEISQLVQGFPLKEVDRAETAADRAASQHFTANLSALTPRQPSIPCQLKSIRLPLQWTFARDGFLTARDDNHWYSGCSVPLAAGREIMKSLELNGTVGCFLYPTHAGQLRACFDSLSPSQAIVAVVPDLTDLAVMLHCEDFAAEISSHRLWFAAGWDWSTALAEIFKSHPGLPIPLQFVRTPLIDDADQQRMISQAQAVFSALTPFRAEQITIFRNRHRPLHTGRICVVAPQQFHLWDMPGLALSAALIDDTQNIFTILDSDDPLTASPMALAEQASESDAVITADCGRSDLPGMVSLNVPWITWITLGRIPAPDVAAPKDSILLTDVRWRPAAIKAGWRDHQIDIASWPALFEIVRNPGQLLGLITDTVPIEMPEHLKTFSSQMLLWELIADDLAQNPLAVGSDPQAYLSRQIRQMSIAQEIDQDLFIKNLIEPAYHQGIARALIAANLPVALIGAGWSEISGFEDFSPGPLTSIKDLSHAARACRALIHPAIQAHPHPIDTFGLITLRPTTPTMSAFTQKCRAALATTTFSPPTQKPLTRGSILTRIPGMVFNPGDNLALGAD